MNYCLYKLRFTTPVHFGTPDSALSLYSSEDHFLADTLFSALCHEALCLWGEEGLQNFIEETGQGKLLLSDAMPWKGDTFFIPRPFFNGKPSSEELTSQQRKAMKGLRWIPVGSFKTFSESMKTGERFPVEKVSESFGAEDEMTRVHIAGTETPLPYQIGVYRFKEDCGLYFIAGCDNDSVENKLSILTEAAGLSGIGGKTTSGLGKFQIEDKLFLNEPFDEQTEWLFHALSSSDSGRYILLSSAIPNEEELDGVMKEASFQLVRRGGFVGSASFAQTPRKKITEYFMSAGSVVTQRFRGSLRRAAEGGVHPVVRFSQPLFLGVDL